MNSQPNRPNEHDYWLLRHSGASHWQNEQTTASKTSTIYQCSLWCYPPNYYFGKTTSFFLILSSRFDELTLWIFRSLNLVHLSFDFFSIWSEIETNWCIYRPHVHYYYYKCVCLHTLCHFHSLSLHLSPIDSCRRSARNISSPKCQDRTHQ